MGFFGSTDLIKFVQAVWPCIQSNYPDLISGVLQIVGGASVLAAALRRSNLGQGGAGIGNLFMRLLNKVAVNPPKV